MIFLLWVKGDFFFLGYRGFFLLYFLNSLLIPFRYSA
jgi:hypothetical protein